MMSVVVERVIEQPEVPLERLEAQICEGAAHLFAGMARGQPAGPKLNLLRTQVFKNGAVGLFYEPA